LKKVAGIQVLKGELCSEAHERNS